MNVVAASRLPPVVLHGMDYMGARKIGENIIDAGGTFVRHGFEDTPLTIRGYRCVDVVVEKLSSEVEENARRNGVMKSSRVLALDVEVRTNVVRRVRKGG